MTSVNPVRNSSRCDSKPSGALNPVRDLSLNGINPALPTGPGPDRGRGRQALPKGGEILPPLIIFFLPKAGKGGLRGIWGITIS